MTSRPVASCDEVIPIREGYCIGAAVTHDDIVARECHDIVVAVRSSQDIGLSRSSPGRTRRRWRDDIILVIIAITASPWHVIVVVILDRRIAKVSYTAPVRGNRPAAIFIDGNFVVFRRGT